MSAGIIRSYFYGGYFMKKALVFLLFSMVMFASCSNKMKILGTWTDIEGIKWVFNADGKLVYENRPGDSREYQYSIFDGERKTELTIIGELDIAINEEQKYIIEYSKDGRTLKLTNGSRFLGWRVAGPGWPENQLTRK
jgi:hypothetical protein